MGPIYLIGMFATPTEQEDCPPRLQMNFHQRLQDLQHFTQVTLYLICHIFMLQLHIKLIILLLLFKLILYLLLIIAYYHTHSITSASSSLIPKPNFFAFILTINLTITLTPYKYYPRLVP